MTQHQVEIVLEQGLLYVEQVGKAVWIFYKNGDKWIIRFNNAHTAEGFFNDHDFHDTDVHLISDGIVSVEHLSGTEGKQS